MTLSANICGRGLLNYRAIKHPGALYIASPSSILSYIIIASQETGFFPFKINTHTHIHTNTLNKVLWRKKKENKTWKLFFISLKTSGRVNIAPPWPQTGWEGENFLGQKKKDDGQRKSKRLSKSPSGWQQLTGCHDISFFILSYLSYGLLSLTSVILSP